VRLQKWYGWLRRNGRSVSRLLLISKGFLLCIPQLMRPFLNLWRTSARLVPKPKVLFRYPAVTETSEKIQTVCDDVRPSSEGSEIPKPVHFKHGILPLTLQCFLYGRMTTVTCKRQGTVKGGQISLQSIQ